MRLLIFGLGYSGAAIARAARDAGHDVLATSRSASGSAPWVIPFDRAGDALPGVDAVVSTVAPGEADPVLAAHGPAIARAPLRWLGYLSTTGVYGDRGGAWVDEATEPRPAPGRSARRLAAEQAWRDVAGGRALDLFRVAGIYGPGRSVLDDVRAGTARRVVKPGHAFGRIHRDDISGAVVAAMARPPEGAPDGVRVLNLTDDLPAPNADVVAEAALLLGVAPPPEVAFEEASRTMSPMGLSFWAENRRVSSAATVAVLGRPWAYPTYREGLRAILAEEGRDRPGE